MIRGRTGLLEELEKQLNELVANQKHLDKLTTDLRDQEMITRRLDVMLRHCVRQLNEGRDISWEATSRGRKIVLYVEQDEDSQRKESVAKRKQMVKRSHSI